MQGLVDTSEQFLTRDFLAGRQRGSFVTEDLQTLDAAMGEPVALPDGHRLVARGDVLTTATILLEGYVLATIHRDGRRFVVGVHVPGNFLDLHGFALTRLDHDLVTSGPVRIARVSHDQLRELTEARPHLARALWFSTLLDAAIHRQWIRNLEALDAPQRIAHLFAELHARLTMIGHNVARTLRTPFTQTDLADMCGVSAIHANRAVARLRELGLGEIRRGALYTDRWDDLRAYAGFDAGYLYGEGQPSR